MTPSCSSISYFPSAQTRNSRNGPTATFPEDSIPAHAGKTPGMDTTSHCVSAHPRSRGENTLGSALAHQPPGSSPLTPGKPPPRVVRGADLRLIPAHAGKTEHVEDADAGAEAHPRSRGENCPLSGRSGQTWGSSPLTRGKHGGDRRRRARSRLIPAHAGKTQRLEKNEMLWPGSSPLTRGKRFLCQERDAAAGLIPAHAGKTAHAPTQRQPSPAHPRSRGENTVGVEDSCLTAGSSPLTRGKRQVDPRAGS